MAVATPGHSTGHTSLVVSSGPRKVFVQGDVTHVPYLFARNPGWHAFYDQDADKAEATPPQDLGHAGGREDDGAGLPLSVPLARLYREDRRPAIAKPWCRGTRRSDLSGFGGMTMRRGRPRGRPFRVTVTGDQANVIAAVKPPQSGCANDRIPSAPTARRGRWIITSRERHHDADTTRHAWRRRRDRRCEYRADHTGARRCADHRQAGAELLSLQDRRLRSDRAERGRGAQRDPRKHGGQQDPSGRPEGARRRVPADRPCHQSVQHPGGEHRHGIWF